MDQAKIKEALKSVVEPTFEDNIVKLRMVGKIEVDGTSALVTIKLPTPAYPSVSKQQLESDVVAAVKGAGASKVVVKYTIEVAHSPAPSDKALLKGPKNVIAVAAGKGGVGKSTVATNLALALARHGAQVGILDTDVFGPSIPTMLGNPEQPAGPTDDKKIRPAIHYGIKVMSVGFFVDKQEAVVWRGPMVHRLLQQLLGDVEWGELDYLICDLPPGTGDVQLSLSQLIPINGSVMVTTPQEVSIIDVVKGISMFEKVEIPITGIVENMAYYQCPACGHHDEIFSRGGGKRLSQEIGVPFLGEIPIDTRIRYGADSGAPIVISSPDSVHSRMFMDIASQVAMHIAKPIVKAPKRSTRLAVIK